MCERFVSYPRRAGSSLPAKCPLSRAFIFATREIRANWTCRDPEGCVLLSILMEAGNLTKAHYRGIT